MNSISVLPETPCGAELPESLGDLRERVGFCSENDGVGFCSENDGKLWEAGVERIHDLIYILEPHTAGLGAEWAWKEPVGDCRHNPRLNGRIK